MNTNINLNSDLLFFILIQFPSLFVGFILLHKILTFITWKNEIDHMLKVDKLACFVVPLDDVSSYPGWNPEEIPQKQVTRIERWFNITAMKTWSKIKGWLDSHPTATDYLVALSLFVLVFLNLWIDLGIVSITRVTAAIALIIFTTVPLALRRRHPLPVLFVMTVSLIVYRHLSFPESPFTAYCLLLAFVSAGVYGDSRYRNILRAGSAFAIVVSLTYIVFFTERIWILPPQAILYKTSIVLFQLFLFIAAWWIGEVFRIRREHELELEIKTKLLEQENESKAQRAIIDERVRIARELHDVVAHHVSVMGIQAAAARRILERQPQKVQELLTNVEQSSRQAISELHRILGFLRGEESQIELSPQPSLAKLGQLIQNMRDAGLNVNLTVEGDLSDISSCIDLSAYRIVQEALTNTLKHTTAATVTVEMKRSSDRLSIRVTDNGGASPHPPTHGTTGRGIIGMRERAALCGGEFWAGRNDAGGFEVSVKFPLEERAV